ncbi:MAG: nuclear transport factor 2 family protein [Rhodothermales bacterium]|nr:nuclear transport factor 2 family protein [Rhodothermales bacterium]
MVFLRPIAARWKGPFRVSFIPPVLLAGWLLAAVGCTPPASRPYDETADRAAIDRLLTDQVEAWNAGDISRFMEGYWASDSLRFASGGTVQQGYQTTMDRYYRAYPDRQTMGTLAFTLEDVRILSPEWATVFGRFHLARDPAIGDARGLFTLMFRKFPEGWRIVSDHTSSE